MTRFWWVRHGPTHEKAFTGWRDVPADLSDRAALTRLNAYLPTGAVLLSSDLIRASATADVLMQGRQRLPDSPDLREFDFGDWDGKLFKDIAETHPDLSRAYWENPGDISPPRGESWNVAARRVASKVEDLLQNHMGRDIIVVAHIGVILTQVQLALGVTPQVAIGHKIDNLSVTCLCRDIAGWQAQSINHIA